MKTRNYARKFGKGIMCSLEGKNAAITLVAGLIFFTAVTLLTFPAYSSQLLSNSIFFIDEAIVSLMWNIVKSAGYLGLALTVLYSMLTGAAVTNTITSIRMQGFKNTRDALGAIPGIAAAGCASCGVGVLGLVGLGGVVALFPFRGNLVRLAAVAIITGVIARRGNPRTCAISES